MNKSLISGCYTSNMQREQKMYGLRALLRSGVCLFCFVRSKHCFCLKNLEVSLMPSLSYSNVAYTRYIILYEKTNLLDIVPNQTTSKNGILARRHRRKGNRNAQEIAFCLLVCDTSHTIYRQYIVLNARIVFS